MIQHVPTAGEDRGVPMPQIMPQRGGGQLVRKTQGGPLGVHHGEGYPLLPPL